LHGKKKEHEGNLEIEGKMSATNLGSQPDKSGYCEQKLLKCQVSAPGQSIL